MSRDNAGAPPRAAETTGPRKSPAEMRFVLSRHELFATRRGGARADLSMQDLSGVSLPGVNLAGAKLTGTDFSNANLRGAIFDKADLFTANFAGADLTGASFVDSDMR
ncbi:MAG: pentapeptide repeat-containing protein, partial [Alphaproteobacteria bacterium]|nr:pentapeptide repeat-containing protein [Alphaproteobacteria bacterium]